MEGRVESWHSCRVVEDNLDHTWMSLLATHCHLQLRERGFVLMQGGLIAGHLHFQLRKLGLLLVQI